MSSAGNDTTDGTKQLRDASEVPQMIASFVVCLIIAYLGVILRLIAVRIKGRALRVDDWLIMGSLV